MKNGIIVLKSIKNERIFKIIGPIFWGCQWPSLYGLAQVHIQYECFITLIGKGRKSKREKEEQEKKAKEDEDKINEKTRLGKKN